VPFKKVINVIAVLIPCSRLHTASNQRTKRMWSLSLGRSISSVQNLVKHSVLPNRLQFIRSTGINPMLICMTLPSWNSKSLSASTTSFNQYQWLFQELYRLVILNKLTMLYFSGDIYWSSLRNPNRNWSQVKRGSVVGATSWKRKEMTNRMMHQSILVS